MVRRPQTALIAVAVLALAGCGGDSGTRAASAPAQGTPSAPRSTPAPDPTPTPAPDSDPEQQDLAKALVPKGVPTEAKGQRADKADLAVVKRWLAALTNGDIPAAADTFADGAKVQNPDPPPVKLRNRDLRLAFNASFPCGAELVTASSVKGYLVVTYRLTDRKGSKCDGTGGTAAGVIKVEGGKMTEWYRLPNPPDTEQDDPGPVV